MYEYRQTTDNTYIVGFVTKNRTWQPLINCLDQDNAGKTVVLLNAEHLKNKIPKRHAPVIGQRFFPFVEINHPQTKESPTLPEHRHPER